MRAMQLSRAAPVEVQPLQFVECAPPVPGPGEIRVEVEVCGVCRTDLHVVEGDLPARRAGIIPGHQVVGRVEARGDAARRFELGDRVGIAWLRRSCGRCRFCFRGDENLCLTPEFTGWDADGGYAERAVIDEDFAYALPEGAEPRAVAPLLCAGIIGFRAWKAIRVSRGGRIGLWGFGGSAHITLQVALHFGCEVYVFTRGGAHRELAEELGAAWVGDGFESPPHPLDGAILFAPAGELEPFGCNCVNRSGPCESALSCFWFSNGCTIGCKECTGNGTRGFGLDTCGSKMKATNNDPWHRTLNRGAEANSAEDLYRFNPWRSPGNAPSFDPCGTTSAGRSRGVFQFSWAGGSL